MSEHHDAALTIASLQMAAVTRRGTVDGVIFHTDRGSEYSAVRFQAACRHWASSSRWAGRLRARQRRRRIVHLHPQGRIRPPAPLRDAGRSSPEDRHLDRRLLQHRRRHSAADGLPPIVYEQQIMTARAATKARSQETIAA
jgi:transposase InsO family protein